MEILNQQSTFMNKYPKKSSNFFSFVKAEEKKEPIIKKKNIRMLKK